MRERISILIPCYNAEQWVAEAIDSALSQSYENCEVIVVDDGSVDNSLEIVKSYGSRIVWETGPNRGANTARNRLRAMATGDWLQYLDADDYLLPDKISKQAAFLSACSKQPDVVYSPVTWDYGAAGRRLFEIPEPHDPWVLLASWRLPQTGGVLWRKQAIADVGGWKHDQPCCQEHELYLRMIKGGKKFAYCPADGAVYRQWSEGTVCHKDIPELHRRILEIQDDIEEHLRESNQLTSCRLNTISQARFEAARGVWQYDPMRARSIVTQILEADPAFRPSGEAAPLLYQWAFRLLGFPATERVAAAARRIGVSGTQRVQEA